MKGLQRLRTQAGLQQKELADLLGVTSPSISHWENGTRDPSLRFITECKELFDCTYDELITGVAPDEDILPRERS